METGKISQLKITENLNSRTDRFPKNLDRFHLLRDFHRRNLNRLRI